MDSMAPTGHRPQELALSSEKLTATPRKYLKTREYRCALKNNDRSASYSESCESDQF
jgi:hypothetical protein